MKDRFHAVELAQLFRVVGYLPGTDPERQAPPT